MHENKVNYVTGENLGSFIGSNILNVLHLVMNSAVVKKPTDDVCDKYLNYASKDYVMGFFVTMLPKILLINTLIFYFCLSSCSSVGNFVETEDPQENLQPADNTHRPFWRDTIFYIENEVMPVTDKNRRRNTGTNTRLIQKQSTTVSCFDPLFDFDEEKLKSKRSELIKDLWENYNNGQSASIKGQPELIAIYTIRDKAIRAEIASIDNKLKDTALRTKTTV